MHFMDYRDFQPSSETVSGSENDEFEKVPSFLYAMPLSSNRVFFEVIYSYFPSKLSQFTAILILLPSQETCLAARPAMPFEVLKERLHQRLKTLGISFSNLHEEVSFIGTRKLLSSLFLECEKTLNLFSGVVLHSCGGSSSGNQSEKSWLWSCSQHDPPSDRWHWFQRTQVLRLLESSSFDYTCFPGYSIARSLKEAPNLAETLTASLKNKKMASQVAALQGFTFFGISGCFLDLYLSLIWICSLGHPLVTRKEATKSLYAVWTGTYPSVGSFSHKRFLWDLF